MKAFLFISKQGDGCALANRIMSEGHRSILYINAKKNRRVGDGIVEMSPISEELILRDGRVRWGILDQLLKANPDVVVMDMVGRGFGKVANRVREMGVPVVGGSVFGNTVELNRPYGSQVMKMMGIPVPETHVFNGFPEAIRFVESSKGAYVYKPSGNKPTHTTYVANGKEDMVGMLKHYSGQTGEFGLQKRVSGIEVSTELWFNGKEVLNVNHTMEEKSLMDNGIGAKTGSMGSVVWEGHQDSRLYREGVGKAVKALQRANYRGPFNLNTIVTKSKLYGLEFTARFGYDAIFPFLEGHRGKVSDLLYGVATGVLNEIKMRTGWNIGITFCIEPYPILDNIELPLGVPIVGLNTHNLRHIWLHDVQMENDRYVCAGNGGNLGVITARGDTIREARRRVYRTMDNLIIPNVMYRRDIGSRVNNDINTLKEQGWL